MRLLLANLLLFSIFCQIGDCCPIQERNQQIFCEVIKNRFQNQKDIPSFFKEIDLIGQEALQKGFDLSCYQYHVDPCTNAPYYTSFPIWEGKTNCDLVFLIFVWPSEQEALKHCEASYYKTNIHSHPMPCAFTVMFGEITERCYERANLVDKSIIFCGKNIFNFGEKSIDLNQESFIHQLLFEGNKNNFAITLHAYGCCSLEDLTRYLIENRQKHVYPESFIVQIDGCK